MHKSRFFKKLSIEDGLALMGDKTIRRNDVWDDKPLFIYGNGNLGGIAREFLDVVKLPAERTLDRKDFEFGVDRSIRLASPRVAVAIITSPYAPIERALRERGFSDIVPFYDLAWDFREIHPLGENGWFAEPFGGYDRDKIAGVLDAWEDDRSRAHHLSFMAWRRLREEWSFARAPVTNEDRYFIPEVVAALHDHEVFLDGGAHRLETVERFKQLVPTASFIAVEPDPENNVVCCGRLPTFPFALGAANGLAWFHAGFGYASRLAENGGNARVEVRTIDSLDIAPTFVKLHLEGGELEALKGGKATLQKHRPIIAATVYHNDDGVWRTADLLMNALEDYRFIFRNHCWCGAGVVVYAIPRERAQ